MFISEAIAQTGEGLSNSGVPQQSWLMSYMPLILIFMVFYFLILRPQNKRMVEHNKMLGTLRSGDKVVTNGGICGEVNKVIDDSKLELTISQGVVITVLKSSVSQLEGKDSDIKAKETNKDKSKSKK